MLAQLYSQRREKKVIKYINALHLAKAASTSNQQTSLHLMPYKKFPEHKITRR